MNNFKETNDIYLIDGTISGLLTLIYDTYKNRILPKYIYNENNYMDNLFDTPVIIDASSQKAKKVLIAIKNKIGASSIETIKTAMLSKDENKYKIIYDFIYYGFKYGPKINCFRTLEAVVQIQKITKNVKHEAHKFKGFVRFSKLKNNAYYAKINPDNDILSLVANHFKYRLKNDEWCIIDEKRKKGAFYNKKEVHIIENLDLSSINISKDTSDNIYEKLWKQFYKSVDIKERNNRRCQMNFMPKKYWNNILEVTSE